MEARDGTEKLLNSNTATSSSTETQDLLRAHTRALSTTTARANIITFSGDPVVF